MRRCFRWPKTRLFRWNSTLSFIDDLEKLTKVLDEAKRGCRAPERVSALSTAIACQPNAETTVALLPETISILARACRYLKSHGQSLTETSKTFLQHWVSAQVNNLSPAACAQVLVDARRMRLELAVDVWQRLLSGLPEANFDDPSALVSVVAVTASVCRGTGAIAPPGFFRAAVVFLARRARDLKEKDCVAILFAAFRLRDENEIVALRSVMSRVAPAMNALQPRELVQLFQALVWIAGFESDDLLRSCTLHLQQPIVLDELLPEDVHAVCKSCLVVRRSKRHRAKLVSSLPQLRKLVSLLATRVVSLQGRFSSQAARHILECFSGFDVKTTGFVRSRLSATSANVDVSSTFDR